MKRILSACLEQTQRFESESDCQSYLRTLERKHVKYQLLERKNDDTGCVIRMKREYNGYPVGEYFD